MEVIHHFPLYLAIGVVKPLPVPDECQTILPLYMIKLATPIYDSYLSILLFVFLKTFIDAVTSRDITKFQCALSRDKSTEDGLVLMETSEIGEEDQLGKMISNCEIKDVGNDGISDEQVFD